MNRPLQFLAGLVSIALAVATGLYGRARYLADVSTSAFPVPLRDIPAYTLLTRADLGQRELPRALQALPYAGSPEELVGRISTQPLPAGLPVARAAALPPAEFRLAPPGLEVVSLPVEPVSAIGGQVRIGERVDLYRLREVRQPAREPGAAAPYELVTRVERVAAGLLVVDVRGARGERAGSPAEAVGAGGLGGGSGPAPLQVLTLAVLPGQVEGLLQALGDSRLQGALLWTTLSRP